MSYFHFQTIRKYTACLLDLFGSIESSRGERVPIKFSTVEKASLLAGVEDDLLHSENVNYLPRMCLTFTGMTANPIRSTNKFRQINKEDILTKDHPDVATYQYNSVPYDFNYSIICQCRGMSEACVIAEQITSYFNPSYTMLVNEMDFQTTPTSVLLELGGVTFDNEEYETFSMNLTTVTFDIVLRGNIYPPIKDNYIIKQIDTILHNMDSDENYRKRFTQVENAFKTYDDNEELKKYRTGVDILDIIYKEQNNTLRVLFNCRENFRYDHKIKFKVKGSHVIQSDFDMVWIDELKPGTKVFVEITDLDGNKMDYTKVF